MHRKSQLLFVLSVAAALCVGAYSAHLRAAPTEATAPALMSEPADAPIMSEDSAAPGRELDPARSRAVTCTCAPAGSGCSGACPNAPGPKRYCKNLAPAGKPKMCSCV